MSTIAPLPPEALYRPCDPEQFPFRTTAELEELEEVLGQERAVSAVRFGIGIRREGYNLFVMGPEGIGKRSLVHQFLDQRAAAEPHPSDWCYINNFPDPQRPRMLRLPPGRAVKLRKDVDHLIEELRSTLPAAFESEQYRTRAQEIEEEIKARQESAFSTIREEAERHNITLIRTPGGFAFAPMKDGEVVNPDDFGKLEEHDRDQMQEVMENLQEQLQRIAHQVPKWQKEARERLRKLNREVAAVAVDHAIDEVREHYAKLPEVIEFLDTLRKDILEHINDFRKTEEGASSLQLLGGDHSEHDFFRRYKVNVLVDHGETHGAPVIYEDHPTYQNLIGRVEHQAQMGALVTDYTLIRAGALHRANGGYLVIDALKMLTQPYAWEGLKRVLRAREIRIESLGQVYSLVSTVSLEPQPIPLELKVVMLGSRMIYYLLSAYDPEFAELFKVAADFEDEIERSGENDLLYARLIGTQARKEKLRPFNRAAVARIIEHAARLVSDAERLSTHLRSIADLQREADYWAGEAGRNEVDAEDVQHAIDQAIRRQDRIHRQIHEEIQRGTILIDTDGERVGQVNGLSVIGLGGYHFGQPSRITATTRLGEGEVMDIERETELGGPIHTKGVMILSSFLAERYSKNQPLSLNASLVFEQSYGMIEGDSASVGELCALLSAIGEVPVRQALAVTGSVNQLGQVQPIGGVNEKIEGFFDVCRARGLAPGQGVVIPASNVKHLMLRADVVEAVREGRFQIYAVEQVDQAVELLTGIAAGALDEQGDYPEGSVNQRVRDRLTEYALLRHTFADLAKEHTDGEERKDDEKGEADD
ncbi:Lon protease family protein [Endothiovibrio diazotrophicus]